MATVTNLNANPRAATNTTGSGTGPNSSGVPSRVTTDGFRTSTCFSETSTPATSATATGLYTVGNGTATSGFITVAGTELLVVRQAAKLHAGTGPVSLFLRVEAWTSAAVFIEFCDIAIRDQCAVGTWYELVGFWKVPSNAARIQIRVVQTGSTGSTTVRATENLTWAHDPSTGAGMADYGDAAGAYSPAMRPDPATLYLVQNDNTMNNATATIGPEQWADMLAELGVTAVRMGCASSMYSWPSANAGFDFGPIGRWINAALRVGIKPILLGPGAPAWLTNFVSDTTTYANWAKLCAAYAQTFPDAAAFDVFNEPNLGATWTPAGTPSSTDYVTLIQTVYPLVKAAVPSMPVLAGCSACVGTTAGANETTADAWWSAVYPGIKSFSDGLSLHPYLQRSAAPTRPMSGSTSTAGTRSLGLIDHVRLVRKYRDANNDTAKQLWLTEGGSSSATGFLSEADQASQDRLMVELMANRTNHPDIRAITVTLISSFAVTNTYGQGLETVESGTFRRKPTFSAVQAASGGARTARLPCGTSITPRLPIRVP